MITVIGIKIIDRIKEAGLTQEILSRNASVITTRLGFHEVTDDICSREAYIILHLNGDKAAEEKLMRELRDMGGIELREINFDTDQLPLSSEPGSSNAEIIGILVERNHKVIASVQRLLTSYGCNIRTRLGVNEVFFGQAAGLIILELKGEKNERNMLEKKLKDLKQVHVRVIDFS